MPTLSKPIAVRFDEDLVQLIEEVSAGQHMTKTDFIREAVLEKSDGSFSGLCPLPCWELSYHCCG
ncbi:TPA: hypothetical protein ACHVE4_001968 [Streptococcus suis]